MKTGIISIIVAIIGISFVIWFNFQTSEMFLIELTKMQSDSDLSLIIGTYGKMNRIIAIGIGLIGLLLGFKSVRNKTRIGIFGIILSICLIILTFIPIWTYLISDSALDIHIKN